VTTQGDADDGTGDVVSTPAAAAASAPSECEVAVSCPLVTLPAFTACLLRRGMASSQRHAPTRSLNDTTPNDITAKMSAQHPTRWSTTSACVALGMLDAVSLRNQVVLDASHPSS
jgi:hypothetical protein